MIFTLTNRAKTAAAELAVGAFTPSLPSTSAFTTAVDVPAPVATVPATLAAVATAIESLEQRASGTASRVDLQFQVGGDKLGVRVCHDMNEGIRGCDVIVTLRLQNERMRGALLPSPQEFSKAYGLTPERLALAKPDAIVMHPGPMNRGVEIDSSVADGRQSVILPQVTFGIAVRMAVMSILGSH